MILVQLGAGLGLRLGWVGQHFKRLFNRKLEAHSGIRTASYMCRNEGLVAHAISFYDGNYGPCGQLDFNSSIVGSVGSGGVEIDERGSGVERDLGFRGRP
jgi:hypothetical protein